MFALRICEKTYILELGISCYQTTSEKPNDLSQNLKVIKNKSDKNKIKEEKKRKQLQHTRRGKCIVTKLKTQVMKKLKISNSDKTIKLKVWQH